MDERTGGSDGGGTNADRVTPGGPRNVVVVLLDSLNRHMLGSYGGTEFATPHLDRFAARSTRFLRHVTGSLPCMPARHDILCGALDFLWRPWGSIELWEQPITADLRHAGRDDDAGHRPPAPVRDRRRELPHRLRRLGLRARPRGRPVEDLARPELDRCAGTAGGGRRLVAAPSVRRRTPRRSIARYDRTRTYFREEADFPGPAHDVGCRAAGWPTRPRISAGDQRWMLFVDEFDPHEPFDTPPEWTGRRTRTSRGRASA